VKYPLAEADVIHIFPVQTNYCEISRVSVQKAMKNPSEYMSEDTSPVNRENPALREALSRVLNSR